MTSDHLQQREALGAYVIGALDSAERHAVEAHIATCDACADELAGLAGLPGLLGRLTADEAAAGLLAPRQGSVDALVERVGRTRARERRRLTRWRAAAVLAVVAVGAVVLPELGGPAADRLVATAQPVGAEIEGTAAAFAWDWGTTVAVDLTELPPREQYRLMAVAVDGRRQQAGAWGATATHSARVRGACAIQRDDLDRVEVTDATGQVLATFDF